MELNAANEDFAAALAAAVPGAVIGKSSRRYREDPRGRRNGQDGLLAVPSSPGDVSAILSLCSRSNVAAVPYGGGTGLVGGQLPSGLPRPVILSLEKLNRVREINSAASVITAEAGCTLQDIQSEAEKRDRLFPLSLASKGSCQIGGNLATNAGGSNVVRYGSVRDLCLGIEAVFADGGIWHGLSGLRKDNRGYDLRNLLIGSEGTLAVITAACLKLFPKPADRVVFLAAVDDPSAALRLFEITGRRFGQMVSAFELISRTGIEFLAETGSALTIPYDPVPDWLVLADIGSECGFGLQDHVLSALEEAQKNSIVTDALFAVSEAQIQKFWAIRESIPEANRRIGAVSSHDISLPIETIPEFIDRCGCRLGALGDFRINCFGHVGDGNLHYNVFPPEAGDARKYAGLREEVRETVHGLVRGLGGSTSAEHGTGRLMAGELKMFEGGAYMAAVSAIKSALDPKGILNPGSVIEHSSGV